MGLLAKQLAYVVVQPLKALLAYIAAGIDINKQLYPWMSKHINMLVYKNAVCKNGYALQAHIAQRDQKELFKALM